MKIKSRGFVGKILCILSVAAISVTFVSGCGEKTVKNVTEKKGELSVTKANYDFVETPGSNKNQPKVPSVQLPEAAEFYTAEMDKKTLGVYKQLYNGFLNFKEEIDITDNVIDKEDIGGLLELCISTSPEISYINQDYTVSIDSDDYVTAVTVKYSKTREQTDKENAQTESRINEIISEISHDWGEYEKVKYFHDTIIKNCTYSENGENAYSAYGCLCEGQAVCEGYTKAMLLLCRRVNIKCIPVVGKGVSSNSWQPHMWNKIMIDGNWYNFDLTWDDPVSDFEKDYVRYDYFGLDDEKMNKDHIPDEKKYMNFPGASSENADYFVRNNLYCTAETDKSEFISKAVMQAVVSGDKYVRMKCADEEIFDSMQEEFFSDDKGNSRIFSILDNCNVESYGFNSSGYSLIKNPTVLTITIKLSSS